MPKPVDLKLIWYLKVRLEKLMKAFSQNYPELPEIMHSNIIETVGDAWNLIDDIEKAHSICVTEEITGEKPESRSI